MQKRVLGLVVFSLLFAFPTSSLAETNINISSNAENSKSNVTVNSNGNDQKHIIIESNGEKKEYHGTDSNVNLELGTNKVTINNNNQPSTPKPSIRPTQSPSAMPSASPASTPDATSSAVITIEGNTLGQDPTKEKDTIFEYVTRIFSSIWDNIF